MHWLLYCHHLQKTNYYQHPVASIAALAINVIANKILILSQICANIPSLQLLFLPFSSYYFLQLQNRRVVDVILSLFRKNLYTEVFFNRCVINIRLLLKKKRNSNSSCRISCWCTYFFNVVTYHFLT
jgi:hypothetical protein